MISWRVHIRLTCSQGFGTRTYAGAGVLLLWFRRSVGFDPENNDARSGRLASPEFPYYPLRCRSGTGATLAMEEQRAPVGAEIDDGAITALEFGGQSGPTGRRWRPDLGTSATSV